MTRSRNLRAVLFDWDGTLADTAQASFRSYVKMFADFGLQFDEEAYARTYSPNWHHTYRLMGLSENQWGDADVRWLRYFADETIHLIDGAREALDLLDRRRILRGIVTSGSRDRIVRELEHHNVGQHFVHVVCGTDVREKKPHPEALHLCLDTIGISPDETAYVGDSPEDVEMARAAGVVSVAIRGAYPNIDALLASRPDYLANSLADAVRYVLR